MINRAAPTRSPWGWACAGLLCGALAATLALAPARWLAAALARGSQAMVLILEPQGSVWSGSGVLALSGGSGSRNPTTLPGRVHWRLRPALDGLRARLDSDCCNPQGPLRLHLSPARDGLHLAISDTTLHWPAAVLEGLGTPFNTIAARGTLRIQPQGLRLHANRRQAGFSGQVQVDGQDLSSRLSPVRPLGSYRARLAGGSVPTLELDTLEGALQISGSGRWLRGRLHFQGETRAAPGQELQLANLLNILGRRQADRAILSFN